MAASMFSNQLAGFSTANPTAAYKEPIEGNSLIKAIRNEQGNLNSAGTSTLSTGQNLFNTGVQGMSIPASYWEKILSGDKTAMSAAAAPTTGAIATNYDVAADQSRRNMARGGYAATLQAELPMQKAAAVNQVIQQLQPQAAQQLQSIAGQLIQAGYSQQQVAVALQQLLLNSQLGVRGQDVQEHGQAMSMATSLAQSAMSLGGGIYATNASGIGGG